MRRITLRFIISVIGLSICGVLLAFVFSKPSDNIHIPESQPIKCDCPEKVEVVPKGAIPEVIITQTTTSHPIVITKATKVFTCKEVEKTSPVQRAIVIYYPHHQSEYFFPEVRW